MQHCCFTRAFYHLIRFFCCFCKTPSWVSEGSQDVNGGRYRFRQQQRNSVCSSVRSSRSSTQNLLSTSWTGPSTFLMEQQHPLGITPSTAVSEGVTITTGWLAQRHTRGTSRLNSFNVRSSWKTIALKIKFNC